MHTQPYFCKKVLVYNHDTMPILHKPHPHGTGGVIIQQGLRVVISQLIESRVSTTRISGVKISLAHERLCRCLDGVHACGVSHDIFAACYHPAKQSCSSRG